ncbi:MAG: hypothetical protein LBC75_08925 [Fibromonadaceae bacterium]|jgi:hypothetical protein|nr:hypothetical protein [Fibromonadaceae bacterium]
MNYNKEENMDSIETVEQMISQIDTEFKAIDYTFFKVVEEICPIGDRLLGKEYEAKEDINMLYIVIDKIEPNLENIYYLISAIDSIIEKAKLVSYPEYFMNKLNLRIKEIDMILDSNNDKVISMSRNADGVPEWFNLLQYESDNSESYSTSFILQILYYECRKAADSFFALINSFRKNEPKINTPIGIANLLTSADVVASIEKFVSALLFQNTVFAVKDIFRELLELYSDLDKSKIAKIQIKLDVLDIKIKTLNDKILKGGNLNVNKDYYGFLGLDNLTDYYVFLGLKNLANYSGLISDGKKLLRLKLNTYDDEKISLVNEILENDVGERFKNTAITFIDLLKNTLLYKDAEIQQSIDTLIMEIQCIWEENMDSIETKKDVDLLKKIILYKDTEIQRSIDILTKEQIEAELENIAVQGVRLVDKFFRTILDFSFVISDITTLLIALIGGDDDLENVSKMEMANVELLIKANAVVKQFENYKKWAYDNFVASEDIIMRQIQSLNFYINNIEGELNTISVSNKQWQNQDIEKRYNNVINKSNETIAIIKKPIIKFIDFIKSKSNFNNSEHLNKLNDLRTKVNGLKILQKSQDDYDIQIEKLLKKIRKS